jgi:hypothetical protein
MKVDYKISVLNKKFDIDKWLDFLKVKISTNSCQKMPEIYSHYLSLVEEFRTFLNCEEAIVDDKDRILTPSEIVDVVESYKIRIRKLLLIADLKLYRTYNVNKKTNVRYIVERAFWIDPYGSPVRYFSKNIGAEDKILVNGEIPQHLIDDIKEQLTTIMWDQYQFEYFSNIKSITTEDGHIVIIK